MTSVNVTVSKTINTSATKVYAIIADYRHHHPHILPKAFTSLVVEEGGQGAGTVFRAVLQVMGQKQGFRMRVSEPEPGRKLAETDLDTGLVTTFTVTPAGNGTSEVTIASTFQPTAGWKGFVERFAIPGFMRRTYRQELHKLDAYARQNIQQNQQLSPQ